MSLVGIEKLNGLYSYAEQKGLSLEEGFEALKSQTAGSNRLALIQSLIFGGLTRTVSLILSSSRQQPKTKRPEFQTRRLQQFKGLLIDSTITTLFGLDMLLKTFTNHMRRED